MTVQAEIQKNRERMMEKGHEVENVKEDKHDKNPDKNKQ